MKKFFVFLLLLLPAAIVSGQQFKVGDITYSVTDAEAKTVTVYLCPPHVTSVTIPSTVTDEGGTTYSVTAIDYEAFYGCGGLTSIEIPSSVTSIGDDAFRDCSSLANIVIPSSVTEIGSRAFEGSAWYNNQENWENGLLYNGTALIAADKTISGNCEIKAGTMVFRNEVFSGCSGLTSITLPDGLQSISYSAFFYCSSLTSIKIPNSVTKIGTYAFYYCSSLKSVILNEGLKSIGDEAFYICSDLTSIEIPSSVTEISRQAFAYCTGLSSIKVAAAVPPTIYDRTFYNVNKTIPVSVPKGSAEAYKAADYWKEFTNFVEYEVIPSAVEETAAAEVSIYTLNGRIYCDAETLAIYNLSGQNVSSRNGSLSGLYIVVADGSAVKVRVN